ncbi:hypothetical protein [Foetidibacter luteolus]|uniref:hypothetical protein n=1 Tax=Foetidibacter luteolus TaxID=2608880 RepID=UPI00129B3AFF|nr:hypothetical protein [Foetidibacter luteolus]
MKKLTLIAALFTIISSCKKTPEQLITGRWGFSFVLPHYIDSLSGNAVNNEEGDDPSTSQRNARLILRPDGSYDLCLLQAYLHGNWHYNTGARTINLSAQGHKDSFRLKVDTAGVGFIDLEADSLLTQAILQLSTADTANRFLDSLVSCIFYLSKNPDRYSSLEKDPYSIIYNNWRVKPLQPETKEQIAKRTLNHLQFLQMIFRDAKDKRKTRVDYNWFSTPFIISSSGVALKFFEDVQQDWVKNFYDSTQAREGYQLLRKCFKHKLKHLDTEDIAEKKIYMFSQMIKNMTEE